MEERAVKKHHHPPLALGLLAGVGMLLALGALAVTSQLLNREEGGGPPQHSLPLVADPAATWHRPDGPIRIALQAGHWKNEEAPDEQQNLRFHGAHVNGIWEWQVNLKIAEDAKAMLEADGYAVEILPTTVPPGYWADVFVAIHADERNDRYVRGFKTASWALDRTRQAAKFSAIMDQEFGRVTGLPRDPLISDEMRGYYAFNWRDYEHALDPMTTAIIVETGYLTNADDRKVIVNDPQLAAQGIVAGITEYLGTR